MPKFTNLDAGRAEEAGNKRTRMHPVINRALRDTRANEAL
jgi:hypothetical protein